MISRQITQFGDKIQTILICLLLTWLLAVSVRAICFLIVLLQVISASLATAIQIQVCSLWRAAARGRWHWQHLIVPRAGSGPPAGSRLQ